MRRIQTTDKDILTRREIKHLCRAIKDDVEFDEPLAILEERNFIRKYIEKTKGRASEKNKISPLIDEY